MIAGLMPHIQFDFIQSTDGILEFLLVLESLGRKVDPILEAVRVLIFSLYDLAARKFRFELKIDCALGF